MVELKAVVLRVDEGNKNVRQLPRAGGERDKTTVKRVDGCHESISRARKSDDKINGHGIAYKQTKRVGGPGQINRKEEPQCGRRSAPASRNQKRVRRELG